MSDLSLDLSGIQSLDRTIERRRKRWAVGGSWVVGTGVEYAVFLEYGTSKMDPRPFFRPVLAEARLRGTADFIETHTRKDPEEITSAAELVETLAFALESRVKKLITEKGLVDTGTLRASIKAVPGEDVSELPSADEVDPDAAAEIEVTP